MHRTSNGFAGAAVLALLALPTWAAPGDEAGEQVPITNPELLQSMGFAPDATHVHATPHALRRMAMGPAEREAVRQEEIQLTAEARSAFGHTLGGTHMSYQAFRPTFSTAQLPAEYGSLDSSRYCLGGNSIYEAQIEGLPHGGLLWHATVSIHDASADEDITGWLTQTCDPFLSGPPVTTILDTDTAPDGHSILNFLSTVGDEITVDEWDCFYSVRVRLGEAPGGFTFCNAGDDLRIQRARVRWRRRVSPAPQTATFDDVPPGHPFFRHVEALVDSEITAGCDADSFCPNTPLTRGQMAVFLATALGLNWELGDTIP